jgi:ABC-2 type transport system ATP-binding protein
MHNPQEMNAISITALVKSYGKVTALQGIDLTVPQGMIYGVVGPNGAGKTTLIKTLVGVARPTSGTARVLELDPLNDKWTLRKQIGYMPQDAALYETLSARDNITFLGKAQSVEDLDQKVDEVIGFTELASRARDPIHTFSGGMKKRVSLACALIHRPKVLFLDEPTAAVDPQLRARSWALFRELAKNGTTLFISTHLMDEALLCDRVTILNQGRVILVDSPQNIMQRGKTRLSVTSPNGPSETEFESTPEAMAQKLHEFGLPNDISSIKIGSSTLEEIVLGIIRDDSK